MLTRPIKGPLRTWAYSTNKGRQYTLWMTNYGTFREAAKVDIYNGNPESGEQRSQIESWTNTLLKAVEDDEYTPADISATVNDASCISIKDKTVTIDVKGKILSVTDGCQRIGALEKLRNKSANPRLVDQLPIEVKIMLDPENRTKDFINLNKGKPVNTTHIRRLLIDIGKTSNPTMSKFSKDLAEHLQKDSDSHLNNVINMFGRGSGGVDFAAITSEHASEKAMSLYGASMIADAYQKDVKWIAGRIIEAWLILSEEAPELVEPGAILCPPPNGKRIPAKMIVGLGNAIAYRLMLTGEEKISDPEIDRFVAAARRVFGDLGDLGDAPNQRTLLGDFIVDFYEDLNDIELDTEWHCGIPISMGKMFSMRAFGREALPKPLKEKKKSVKKMVVVESLATPDSTEIAVNQVDVDTDPAFEESLDESE